MASRLSRRDRSTSLADGGEQQKKQLEQVRKAIGEIEAEHYALRSELLKGNAASLSERYSRLVKRVLNELPAGSLAPWLCRLLLARLRPGSANEPVYSEYLEELRSYNTRKVCGLVFKEGDLAYNCRTCEADPTCVLCQDCFNDSEHEGHDVSFHKTSPGGCCDCGDEEAWAKSGFCSRHGRDDASDVKDPRKSLPTEIRAQADVIFAQVIPFISETTSEVLESFAATIPPSNDAEEVVPKPDEDAKYHVLIHHDEIHTDREVITALNSPPTNMTIQNARQITTKISKEGRGSVSRYSGDPKKQLRKARQYSKHLIARGLLVSVTKTSQLSSERKAITCIEWLQHLVETSDGLARCLAHAISEVPIGSRRERGAQFMQRKCPGWPDLTPAPAFSARRGSNNKLELSVTDGHQPVFLDDSIRFNPLYPKRFVQALHKLYMHLLVDARFKEMFAYVFVDCYLGNAVAFGKGIGTTADSVLGFAVQLFTVPSVVRWLATMVKANKTGEQLSSLLLRSLARVLVNARYRDAGRAKILDLAHPTIMRKRYTYLTNNYDYLITLGFAPLIEPLNSKDSAALKKKMKAEAKAQAKKEKEDQAALEQRIKDAEEAATKAVEVAKAAEEEAASGDKAAISKAKKAKKAATEANAALKTAKAAKKENSNILTSESIELLSKFGTSHMHLFLNTLRVAQGMDPQKRHTRSEHVAFESNAWEYAFWLSISLNNMIRTSAVQLARSFVNTFNLNPEELTLMTRSVITATFARIYDAEQQLDEAYRYKVRRVKSYALGSSAAIIANVANGAPATYHLQLHRFLTSFIMQLVATRYSKDQAVVDMRGILAGYSSEQEFNIQLFMEQPLRTMVMGAQINASMWKRNGSPPHLQQQNYHHVFFSTQFKIDIGALQLGAAILPAPKFLTLLLNRFGILRWFFLEPGETIQLQDADARGLVRLLIPKRPGKTLLDQLNSLPPAKSEEYHMELNQTAASMGEEFFRLLAILCTEVPTYNAQSISDDDGAGQVDLRRAVVHKLAEKPSSFSMISDYVRALRIRMRPRDGTASGGIGDDETDILPTASMKDVEDVLDKVAKKTMLNGIAQYELLPEVWDEFDPMCWYMNRELLQKGQENRNKAREESLRKQKGTKKKANVKVEPCAIVGAPPSPVQPSFLPVRQLAYSAATVQVIRVALADAVTANRDLVMDGVIACKMVKVDEDSVKVDGVSIIKLGDNQEEYLRAMRRTTVSLHAGALHVLTLGLRALKAMTDEERKSDTMFPKYIEALTQRSIHTPEDESALLPQHLSTIELLLAMRGYSADIERLNRDSSDMETAGIEWCIRTIDLLGTTNAQDQIDAVEEWHRKQRLASKKGGKGGMTRAERAKAAQKAAMDRMMKKQKKAQKAAETVPDNTFSGEDDDLDDVEAEFGDENETSVQMFECSMCHEHDRVGGERPMVFIGFAQKSTWGTPKPVAVSRTPGTPGVVLGTSTSSIVRQACKPAGWEVPDSYFGSATAPTVRPSTSATNPLGRVRTASVSSRASASGASVRSDTSMVEDLDWGLGGEDMFDAMSAGDFMDMDDFDDDFGGDEDDNGAGGRGRADGGGNQQDDDDNESDAGAVEVELVDGNFVTRLRSESMRSTSRGRSGSQLAASKSTSVDFTMENLDTCPRSTDVARAHHHVNMTFCSHVLHISCMDAYYDSLKDTNVRSGFDIRRREFLCPVCKKLSNVLIPFSAMQKNHSSVVHLNSSLQTATAAAFAAHENSKELASEAATAQSTSNTSTSMEDESADVGDDKVLKGSSSQFQPLPLSNCGGVCGSGIAVTPERWVQWASPYEESPLDAAEVASESSERDVLDGIVGEMGLPTSSAPVALATTSRQTAKLVAAGCTTLLSRMTNISSMEPGNPDLDDLSPANLTNLVLTGWDALWFSLVTEESIQFRANGTTKSGSSPMGDIHALVECTDKHSQQWINLMHTMRHAAVSLLGPNTDRKALALSDVDGPKKKKAKASGEDDTTSPGLNRRMSRRVITKIAKKKIQKALGLKSLKWRPGMPSALTLSPSQVGSTSSQADGEDDGALDWCDFDVRIKHPLMKMVMSGSAAEPTTAASNAYVEAAQQFNVLDWLCDPLQHLNAPPYFVFAKANPSHVFKSANPGFEVCEETLALLESATDGGMPSASLGALSRGGTSGTLLEQLCSSYTGVKLVDSFEVSLEAKDAPGLSLNFTQDGRLFVSAVEPKGRLMKEGNTKRRVKMGDYILRINNEPIEGMSLQTVMRSIVGPPKAARRRISTRRTNEPSKVSITFGRFAQPGALLDVKDPFMLFIALSNSMNLPNMPAHESAAADGSSMEKNEVGEEHVCVEHHIMAARTCAIVSVVQALVQSVWGNNPRRGAAPTRGSVQRRGPTPTKVAMGIQSLAKVVVDELIANFVDNVPVVHVPPPEKLEEIGTSILLPYLRQVTLYFSLTFGGDWRSLETLTHNLEKDKGRSFTQLEVLLTHFGLDRFHEFGRNKTSIALVSKWVQAWCLANPNAPANGPYRQLLFKARAPSARFNFIPLPKQYDSLYSKVLNEARCPSTGGSIKDPALCLRCGAVICAGKKCCRRRGIGAVGLHISACCGDAGAVLMMQYSQVLLVRGPYAVFLEAPYVDSHGEQDPGLTRGRPLKLDPSIYQELERLCYSHVAAQKVYDKRARSERVIVASYY